MSYGYMKKEVERLREDIEALVTQAYQQDEADDAALGSRRGDALPAELARREDRLARIEAAMRRLEAQAKAEAEAERQRRAEAEAERQRTGKPRRGKAPPPVEDSPDDKAQSNFTDPELHIMRTNNKGWDYCGNAQASVDGACQIIVACDVTDATNDKQQAEPMAQATRTNLAQAVLSAPRTSRGPSTPSRPRWIMAIIVKRQWRPWRPWGSIRTSPSGASGTMGLRRKCLSHPRQRKSAWQRKYRHLQGKACMPDGRPSWNRCLARSKKRVVSAASCFVAWPPSVANGVWYV